MGSDNRRPRRLRRRRRWPLLLLAAAAVTSAAYLLRTTPAATGPGSELPLSGVRIGTLAVTVDADAVIVRREQVVRAPQAGAVRRLAAEGGRVRVGGAVVEFVPGALAASPAPEGTEAAAVGTGSESVAGTGAEPAGGSESTPAPPGTDPGSLPTVPSAARLEYERLAAEIYATAVALNEALAHGLPTSTYQERLNELARAQDALLPALRLDAAWAGTEAAPLPSAPPTPSPSPTSPPDAQDPPEIPAGWPVGEAQVVTTDVSGVVLYQTDGLEEILTPEAVAGWGPASLLNLPYPDVTEAPQGTVAQGAPLFKLVDDLQVEMLLLVPAERLPESARADLLANGATLKVAGRDLPLEATVLRIAEEGEHVLLHLSAPLPSADALRVRRIRVSLLLAEYEGTILPRSAVDVEGGRTGVWVARRNGYRFVPARVLGGTDDEVAVEADLSPDAEVLTEPPPPAAQRLAE
ncbi:HlyD family efflux transporter periplasmic adaptor subunit [Symbiobacterium terraclitae]|uniref:HlyD family efflux transporter periplasmic adaptor subunit n=1 Tax=Symbiobacterium terraclitae TaxID=557451 RepID=UPI0035B545B8